METFAPSAWAEIIAKAAVSPLGIAALVSLIVGFVALALFQRSDKAVTRLGVIALLMLFCGGLMGAAVYGVRPVAPSPQVAQGAPGTPATAPAAPSSASAAASGAASQALPTAAGPVPAITAAVTTPPAVARADCGSHWTGWKEVGGAVGSPCPDGCGRGDELGQSYRIVGFPPRPQTQHKFQCWRQ